MNQELSEEKILIVFNFKTLTGSKNKTDPRGIRVE